MTGVIFVGVGPFLLVGGIGLVLVQWVFGMTRPPGHVDRSVRRDEEGSTPPGHAENEYRRDKGG